MSTVAPIDAWSVLRERRSVRHFDPAHKLEEQEIRALLETAGRAPSSWNLQHWKFVVFTEPAAKAKLFPIANRQKQVLDASVTVAVLGDLEAHRNTEAVYGPLVRDGREDSFAGYATYRAMTAQIEAAYAGDSAVYRRDEAIRNASLAAMQLLLAATARGLDAGPMVGFDAAAFVREFRVPSRYLPVLLVAIGKASLPARPTSRFPVEQTAVWNGFEPDDAHP